jgi:hypothetical protein
MAVKISRPLSFDEACKLADELSASRDPIAEAKSGVNNPACSPRYSAFYLSESDTYRIVFDSQYLRRGRSGKEGSTAKPPEKPDPRPGDCPRCGGAKVIVLNNPPRTVTCPACKGTGRG